MQEATFLTRFAAKVTVIHRRETLRASPVLIGRAHADDKVDFLLDAQVVGIVGDAAVEAVVVEVSAPDGTVESRTIACDGVFLAVGHIPNTALVAGQVTLDAGGFVSVAHPSTATDVAGVFAGGDVADPLYRQAVTAAATGCKAALDAQAYLAQS